MTDPAPLPKHRQIDNRYLIEWQAGNGERHTATIPVNVRPYVDVLGIDRTTDFLIAFAGRALHLSARPHACGAATKLLGKEAVSALATAICESDRHGNGTGYVRVPCDPRLIARLMRRRGASHNEIVRVLKRTGITVKTYLQSDAVLGERKLKRSDEMAGRKAK